MNVKYPADLAWIVCHRLVALLDQELSKIQPKNIKNHGSGNGYCTENHESQYQTRLGAFKQQTGCLTVALKENTMEKNQDTCCHYTVMKSNPLYR